MPTARKKEEVPRWFILAANLSLKLHQENSFLAFERVVRCGGLLSALPPELAAKQLKCFYDLSDFRSRSFNAIAAQVVMVLLTYTLRQWQLWKFLEESLANLTPEALALQLRLLRQWIVIYLGLAYTQLPVVSFTREAMHLEGEARQKALRKLDLLEQALFTPVPNPRPM